MTDRQTRFPILPPAVAADLSSAGGGREIVLDGMRVVFDLVAEFSPVQLAAETDDAPRRSRR